ncbi:hypothetical protein GCM10007874_25170 [Labrys miyagiensis]|uniref:DUF541 domain-containing protein n=1 Tax=Labrys miyagiensis TaxID=346912 RepID=A0ABQ6CHU5_9HYPH|nr:SIMPL domain-containing protein [Labrys miyagiensis]GLS19500.1 hypothetical protein GCM10007874_25170 [Labrys miyagiensis]
MRPSLLARPALAVFLLAGSLGLAHADDLKRSISITGEASVSAKPDVAYVSIGVENAGKVANEVLAANSKTTGDVLAALKGAGIDAKDLQTSGFTVQPQILRPQNSSLSSSDDSPSITGYTVANTVNVTLHDLPKLGDVLDKAVTAGANSIDGIQFDVSNPSALLDDARKAALADARRKAQIYADAAGLKLGKLVELSENAGPVVGAVYRARMATAAVPIESGSNTLNVTVSVRFELDE